MRKLRDAYNVRLGCDPEFFFKKGSAIIGAEKVIDKDGVKSGGGNVIIDGVQAELNPHPETCRAYLGNNIASCFRELVKQLEGKSIKCDFSQVVKMSKDEMDSLSDSSKVFGCAPSFSLDNKAVSKISVDPKVYMNRSAGGHIHIGVPAYEYGDKIVTKAIQSPERLVPILDIIVGNTCVLLDRDEGNKERRKVYGRAGEYRTPAHGLEYRTLSNFWLRRYELMGFVMGLARTAVDIVAYSTSENNYEQELKSLVKREDIVKAINENDFDLAYSNFKKIEKFLMSILPSYSQHAWDDDEYGGDENTDVFPLHGANIKMFHHFIKKGLDYWFDGDTVQHWVNLHDGHGVGWESFLENQVAADMRKEGQEAK